jgi:type I restriction enzyme S subunit
MRNLTRFTTGWTPPTSISESFDGDVLWANISDLGPKYLFDTAKRLSREAVRAHNIPMSPTGSLLFSFKLTIGSVSVAATDLYTNEAIATFLNSTRLSVAYAYYALPVLVVRNATTNIYGAPMLNAQLIRSARLAVPPIDEQHQIADYLDAQTAKMDALIGKQERLIETLAERLDGAWSAAVDHLAGRSPTVPLRRAIDSIVDGPFGSSLASTHYSDHGAGVVRLGNIGIDEFKSDDRAYIPLEYAAQLAAHAVKPGDVVVAGLGDERMPLGRAAIVPEDFGPGIVKADCYRVRPGSQATARYLAWVLSSPQARTQFRALSRGSTRQRLNTQVVRDVLIPLPSLDQQERAVARFRQTRLANATLSAKAREMIDVLKERRRALISAAVTGKIDVRGLA